MPRKDLSMIALSFFLTRCFFNMYTFTNIYSYLLTASSILILIIIMKQIKINILETKLFKWLYLISMLLIFAIILINATNFININYFRYNNYLSVGLSLLTISYIIGKDKIKTIASISEIFLFIFIVIALLISISLISLIKVGNYESFVKFNNFGISYLPYLLVFVLFYIRKNNIVTGYIIGSCSSFFDILLVIGTLGTKLPLTYSYPGISILKTITFFNFVNHLDKLFSFIYLFEYTIALSLIINIMKNIIKKESN